MITREQSRLRAGYDGEVVVFPGTCTPMSTAIARIYTPEGFVIATDGRATDPDDGTWFAVQKLFPIEQPARRLAYILADTVAITRKNSKEIVFDFAQGIVEAIKVTTGTQSRSLYEYARELATVLDVALKCATKAAKIPPPDPDIEDWDSTSVFIDGYCGKHPERAHIQFIHDGDDQTIPKISAEDLKHKWWGSKEIASILFDEVDPRLAAYKIAEYRVPAVQPTTLLEAIEMARRYVSAHCDPKALEIDRRACSKCGPPIRIATITFPEGFRWVE